MNYLPISFLSGVLTLLAPCVLPILPVVLGSALNNSHSRLRPFTVIGSLGVSIVVFTLLLKFSTSFINVDPLAWTLLSGGIFIFFGLITFFPQIWDFIEIKLSIGSASGTVLQKTVSKKGFFGDVLLGAALGPVFSSCSPTYFVILAVVLPQSFWIGLLNLIFYAAGLVLVFSFVGLLGQRYLRQIKWISNPKGYFKKVLGATFIILGIFIIAGIDKKVETYILDLGFLDITNFETMLLSKLERESPNKDIFTQEDSKMKNQEIMLNVKYPYKAPSFVGLTSWFNSEPLELEDLKGKVVIVDFWTYSCINCIRTLPYLEKWHEKYSGQGLVIIGVHSPEFVFEKVPDNVEGAVKKYGLQYPIALDSDFKTWRAYDNHYWPAKYFIDKDGKVRHTHFGEGAYEESELIIRQLLGELNEGSVLDDELVSENKVSGSVSSKQSPETYLNYERGANLSPVNANEFAADKEVFYSIQTKLSRNEWSLGGTWLMGADHSEARAEGAKLKYNFSAKEVYLVMGPSSIKSADAPKSYKVKVFLNGEAINVEEAGSSVNSDGIVIVDRHDLYKLVNLPEFASDQILELQFDSGVEVNAFTFGS